MLSKLRAHVRSQFVGYLALFVALGGTAYAAVVVSSNSQVAKNTISGHKPPSGKHANVIPGSINGTDIANRSGVDTCAAPLVKKLGPLCVGGDGAGRTWEAALEYCAKSGLRLPGLSEAYTLARNFDVPHVSTGDYFWTDHRWYYQEGTTTTALVWIVGDDASANNRALNVELAEGQLIPTICVTDPSA